MSISYSFPKLVVVALFFMEYKDGKFTQEALKPIREDGNHIFNLILFNSTNNVD